MSLESASFSPPVKRNGAALLVASTALHHRQRQQQQQQQQHRRRRRQRPKQGGSNSYLQPQQEEEDAKRAKSKKKQRHNMGDPSLLEESFRTFWQVQQKMGERHQIYGTFTAREGRGGGPEYCLPPQKPCPISNIHFVPRRNTHSAIFPLSPFSLSPSFGRSRITKQRRDKKIGQKNTKSSSHFV